MAKKTIKVYLDDKTEKQLKDKAKEFSIEGRAWLTHFLEKIAPEDLIIADSNLKKTLKLMDLK
jgi:hypothetical protein